MADVIYNRAAREIAKGVIDLDAASAFKVALITSGYTPDKDHNSFATHIQPQEASGAGYTAGGATLANTVVTEDDTNDFAYWDGDDVVWPASTITARYAVVYHVASGVPVVCKDFGTNKSSSGDNFTVQWATPANGAILKLSQP
jgi:hypothetical protein